MLQAGQGSEVGQPHGVKDLTQPAPWHDEHTVVEPLAGEVWLSLPRPGSALLDWVAAFWASWLPKCGLTTMVGIGLPLNCPAWISRLIQ